MVFQHVLEGVNHYLTFPSFRNRFVTFIIWIIFTIIKGDNMRRPDKNIEYLQYITYHINVLVPYHHRNPHWTYTLFVCKFWRLLCWKWEVNIILEETSTFMVCGTVWDINISNKMQVEKNFLSSVAFLVFTI